MTPSIRVVIETSNRCAVDVWPASAVSLTSQQQDPVHYAHHYRHCSHNPCPMLHIPLSLPQHTYRMHGADRITIPLSDQGVKIRAVRKEWKRKRKRRKRQKKGPHLQLHLRTYYTVIRSTVGLITVDLVAFPRWLESCMEDEKTKSPLSCSLLFPFSFLQTKNCHRLIRLVKLGGKAARNVMYGCSECRVGEPGLVRTNLD